MYTIHIIKRVNTRPRSSFLAPSPISGLPTAASRRSIRVTQRSYKASTPGPWAFSRSLYMSGPGVCISFQVFSWVGSSHFWGTWRRGCDWGLRGGGTAALLVPQSLLSPLKLEANPKIQAVHTWEKKEFKTFNSKFTSFTKQVNGILETEWSLEQQ